MERVEQALLRAGKWAASFAAGEWGLEQYPIWVRRNSLSEPEFAWRAQILGWPGLVGLGATPQEARDSLKKTFGGIRQSRTREGEPMPRPGSTVPVQFASTARLDANPRLVRRFIEEVLQVEPYFISDESNLFDFGLLDEEVERFRERIRAVFGVETNDLEHAVIADIIERIQEQGCGREV